MSHGHSHDEHHDEPVGLIRRGFNLVVEIFGHHDHSHGMGRAGHEPTPLKPTPPAKPSVRLTSANVEVLALGLQAIFEDQSYVLQDILWRQQRDGFLMFLAQPHAAWWPSLYSVPAPATFHARTMDVLVHAIWEWLGHLPEADFRPPLSTLAPHPAPHRGFTLISAADHPHQGEAFRIIPTWVA